MIPDLFIDMRTITWQFVLMVRDAHRLDRTKLSIASLSQADDTKAFWATQTPAQRLAALELCRQLFYAYDPTTARLQRILEIVERPWR